MIRVKRATDWKRVYHAALATEGKDVDKEPSDRWKKQMLLCEHSPIRLLEFDVRVEGIKQWITVHLVRHWLGFIPFVHSQRDDRRQLDCNRDDLPQGSLNDMEFAANAQALINISRKRLCGKAHPETRKQWSEIAAEIEKVDPIMGMAMVPECIYRGFCSERKSCGFCRSEAYKRWLTVYREIGTRLQEHGS